MQIIKKLKTKWRVWCGGFLLRGRHCFSGCVQSFGARTAESVAAQSRFRFVKCFVKTTKWILFCAPKLWEWSDITMTFRLHLNVVISGSDCRMFPVACLKTLRKSVWAIFGYIFAYENVFAAVASNWVLSYMTPKVTSAKTGQKRQPITPLHNHRGTTERRS